MAKTKPKSKAAEEPRATQRVDPERWARLFIVGGAVMVILLVAGIIGFGWYWTEIRPLDKTVLQVGETKFSLRHLERRMSLELQQTPVSLQTRETLLALPDTVLLQLEQEAKLLEGAGELNVSVSDQEVDEEIRRRAGLDTDVEGSVFAAELRRQVETSGLKFNEFRQMIRAELLQDKVQAHFAEQAPEREVQVRASLIGLNLDAEEEAQALLDRLAAGEEFAALIEDLPLDASSDELDWTPQGIVLDPDIEEFLFEAEPGDLSDIISTPFGLFIVELVEREEDRELDEVQRQQFATRDLVAWLGELDATLDVERDFTREDASRALSDVLA